MKSVLLAILFTLSILTNALGQFTQKNSYSVLGDEITYITFANIDNDSLPEAITAVRKGSQWSLYAAKPFLTNPASPVLIADLTSTSNAPTLLDWNGDQYLDFVFTTPGAQNVILLLNGGNLTFSKTQITIGSNELSQLEFKDLNNDESREAIAIKKTGGYSIFRGNGKSFALTYDSAMSITDFSIFDFDGNGYNDVALSGSDAAAKPFLKIIEFEDSLNILRTVSIANAIKGKIESGDLNHDGQFDLIVSGVNASGQNAVQSFINNDSVFVSGNSYKSLTETDIKIADFDSDGKADVSFFGKDNGGILLHWIKTFSGDSISLPTQNITHRSLGDFDRDGDLDLLLSTDTLGVIVLENTALKNRAPIIPTNEVSAFIFNRLFLYWDESTDDHTPQPSLTYDLQLYRSGSEVINGEFDPDNGLRQTTTNGNLGTNNFHLMKASIGNYDFKIEGVDNSFYAQKILVGSAGGNCTAQQPKTITVCDNKPVKLTEAQPVMWFSFRKGFLGKSTTITADLKTDTIFSFLPHASNVCNAINLYLLNVLKKDTLKVVQNFIGCEGTALSFNIGAEWKSVSWKDANGTTKGTGNTLGYTISKDETIIGTGNNDHGCFIRQTENIKLSKPSLVLDGTDYKIVFGGGAPLGVSGASTYVWSPATGLSDANSSHPLASPAETTTYTVTGYDSLHCSAQAQVLVEVSHKSFIPNLFTPNGDGKNDELKIYGLASARDFHFSIYNREGSLVYESSDLAAVSWDGSKNGTPQPAGLYYWKVQGVLDNGQPLFLNDKTKGSILLVR